MQVPAPFDYERATSVDHALQLLADRAGEARIVAGGHSLLPMMKLRLAQPELLIDINDLTDLDYIRLDGNEIAIGAMTRHASLLESALLAEHYSIFADAERVIADPIVRNRGTIGGSLCQADPSEDLSAVVSALRASIVIQSASGRRTVAARDFHQGPYETAVGEAEMLVEVRVPTRPGAGSAYEKVERRAGDWAVASAGAFVQIEGDTIVDAGLGLTAVGARHFTCIEAEELLRGHVLTDEVLLAAAQLCHDACEPQADQRGPVDYKRHLARELSLRVLRTSIARARGENS
ncbi:MAG: FAD binding domain-containing protein [Actinomycetes bacterium]